MRCDLGSSVRWVSCNKRDCVKEQRAIRLRSEVSEWEWLAVGV